MAEVEALHLPGEAGEALLIHQGVVVGVVAQQALHGLGAEVEVDLLEHWSFVLVEEGAEGLQNRQEEEEEVVVEAGQEKQQQVEAEAVLKA